MGKVLRFKPTEPLDESILALFPPTMHRSSVYAAWSAMTPDQRNALRISAVLRQPQLLLQLSYLLKEFPRVRWDVVERCLDQLVDAVEQARTIARDSKCSQ